MNIRMSRSTVLVLSALATSAIALAVQPCATFAKPSLVAHKSVIWSGARARRDGYAFFPAPRPGLFATAPRSINEGTCDVADNPWIC
jgi:hypothetical protein